MTSLSNKQKIIIISILVFMVIIIFYYFLSQNNNYTDYSYLENISENILIDDIDQDDVDNETIIIHITGSIKNPGVIKLNYGSRIIDAIEAAGGLLENANLENVNLAYVLEDAQKLYIPNNNDSIEEGIISSDNGQNIIEEIDNSLSENLKININSATQTEFELLPGIGPSTALKIVEYRSEHGKFSSIDEIKNVSGIGDSKFNSIKDFIFVK